MDDTSTRGRSAGPAGADAPDDGDRASSGPLAASRAPRLLGRWAPFTVLMVVVGVLVVVPLLLIGYASIVETPPRAGRLVADFTLSNFDWLLRPSILVAARNTLIIGLGGTAIAMSIGATLAWLAARTNVPGKRLIQVAGVVPLFISALVGALSWSLIASPQSGYVNIMLRDLGIDATINIHSMAGIIFVLGLYYAPYTFLFSYSAFTLMNPELEEAASVHGANRFRVARSISMPLIAPALLSSAILTLILVMENFPVPYVLGARDVPTLPTSLFLLVASAPPRPNEASALGVALVILVAFLVYVQREVLRRRNYTTVTGKGFQARQVRLSPVGRWVGFGFGCLYLLLSVGLPYFALLQSSLRSHSYVPDTAALFDTEAFGLQHYSDLIGYGPFTDALANTLVVGLITALGGGIVHFAVSYYVHRTRLPGRGLLDYVTTIPVALPALVIGIGLLWTWLVLPIPIYGTLAAIGLAFVARFMPHGYRSISSTIGQVHPELEESARVAGASRLRVISFVVLPLVKTGVVSTMLMLFIMSVRELSAALFLYTADTRVLSILLFEQWEGGSWHRAAALSVVYSVMLLVITMAGWRFLDQSRAGPPQDHG